MLKDGAQGTLYVLWSSWLTLLIKPCALVLPLPSQPWSKKVKLTLFHLTKNLNFTPIYFNSTDPNVDNNDTQIGTECPFPDNFFDNDQNNNSTSSKTFDWTAQEQGVVLGCFYYGFVTTMLPGAFLGKKNCNNLFFCPCLRSFSLFSR